MKLESFSRIMENKELGGLPSTLLIREHTKPHIPGPPGSRAGFLTLPQKCVSLGKAMDLIKLHANYCMYVHMRSFSDKRICVILVFITFSKGLMAPKMIESPWSKTKSK